MKTKAQSVNNTTAEYANSPVKRPDQRYASVPESLVIVCGFDSHLGYFTKRSIVEHDSANRNGLLVKRQDTCLASRKSGFDSPAVHSEKFDLEGSRIRLAGPLC